MLETRILASYVTDTRLEEIPQDVRHEARRAIVNFMACAVGGSAYPADRVCPRHSCVTKSLSDVASAAAATRKADIAARPAVNDPVSSVSHPKM